jgi:hypothetical protein
MFHPRNDESSDPRPEISSESYQDGLGVEQLSLSIFNNIITSHPPTMATATLSSAAGTSSETQPRQPIWLRCEKKEHERRSALTPSTAKQLIDNNFDVFVERDEMRIFDDEEFEACVVWFWRVRSELSADCASIYSV